MIGKAEARVARRLAKTLKEKEHTVRLLNEPPSQSARSEYAKEHTKEVRVGADPGSIMQMQMSWTVDHSDREGEWSWGVERQWSGECWQSELQPKLDEFAKLSWAEIVKQAYGNEGKRHRAHHLMEVEFLVTEARERIAEIGQSPDTVFRFRLGNRPRLWGVRVVAEFRVLWYDPTHQVYPVD